MEFTMRKIILTTSVLALTLFANAAYAKLYKWVDNQGVTHYGETIPAEYASKDRAELGKSGRIVSKTDIATPAERQAQAAKESQDKIAAEADKISKQHDKSLLNTYSNVSEIELSRKRNTQQVDIRLESASKQVASDEKTLAEMQTRIDRKTLAKQKIDAYSQEDLADAKTALAKSKTQLEGFKQDKARLEAKFAAELARYKELTGK
jgi:Domain of unknown function (DUF4124)